MCVLILPPATRKQQVVISPISDIYKHTHIKSNLFLVLLKIVTLITESVRKYDKLKVRKRNGAVIDPIESSIFQRLQN